MAVGGSRNRDEVKVTIPSGQSLSNPVAIGGKRIIGIKMPAAWDAAGITFAALTRRADGPPVVDTYGKVQDSAGAEVTITSPAADTYVAIVADSLTLMSLGMIRVRSGTSGVPVNQTAQRDFYLVLTD